MPREPYVSPAQVSGTITVTETEIPRKRGDTPPPILIPGPQGIPGPPGPEGPPGEGSDRFEHDQMVASDTWVVTHGLGVYPSSVAVVDTANTLVHGGVRHIDVNTVELSFSAPFSGKAYIGS